MPTLLSLFFRSLLIALLAVPGVSLLSADRSVAGDAPEISEQGTPGPFDPSSIQFDFAGGLLSRKLYEEAAAQYGVFLEKHPKDPRIALARLHRAEAYLAQNNYREAADDFYAFLSQNKFPEHKSLARLRYGTCLFELKQYQLSVNTLLPLVSDAVKDATMRQTASYYMGRSYQFLKQYPQALKALESVKAGELVPMALFARAEILAVQEKHLDAANLFATFAKQYPRHSLVPSVLLRRGEELRTAGKLTEAAQSFQALLDTEAGAESRLQGTYGLAWVRYGQKDFVGARKLAAEVIAAKTPDLLQGARYLQGLAAFRLKDWAQAQELLGQVSNGTYLEAAMRQRAWAFLMANDAPRVLEAVQAVRKTFPQAAHAELNYLEGEANVRQGKWAAAITALEKARAAKAAYHAEAAYALAYALEMNGTLEKASKAYAYFSATFTHHERLLDAMVGEGRTHMTRKDYVGALPVYAKLLEMKSTPPAIREHAYNQQAVCYYWLKQYANMHMVYKKLLEEFPHGSAAPEALYWLAWYEASEKRFDKASDLYGRLLRSFATHALAPKARYRQAMCYYQGGNEEQAAMALFVIATKHPNIQVDQQELLWTGSYLMDHERFDEADKVLQVLLDKQPGREVRAITLYRKGELRRRQKDWTEALLMYQRLLAEKDTGMEAAARYGAAVCHRHLNDRKAARTLLNAISLPPDDPLIARIDFELGQIDLAEKQYKSAAERLLRVGILYDDETLCGEALLNAGDACEAMGDKKKAQVCYAELSGTTEGAYGRRYPKSKYTKEGKSRLQRLSKTPPPPAKGTG